MAKEIGLNNNPAGSAVALGLAKVFKEWMLKHTSGKANNLVSKISTKSLGKALIYANVANAANQTVADFLPHVNAAVTWVGALPANVLNQTLGRIPVLGKIFRTLHNWITEAVSSIADFIGLDAIAATGRTFKLSDPNTGFETQIDWKSGKTGLDLPEDTIEQGGDANMSKQNQSQRKVLNAPSFYERLDLHKTFHIPGAYTKKTVVNGTMATPKLAVHRLVENPVPDTTAIIDRLNQKFSLIKAVRGLSATSYNIVDLFNYERFAKLNLLIYFTLKKVISAAKTYSLVQTHISDNIIKAYGFDPNEVRDNLANYETLLCQIHRFISNNLPVSGTWIKRLEYLVGANVPDYSDPKVATIHMFAVSMNSVFYDPKAEDSYVFDCIPNASNNNYSVVLGNFTSYQQAIVNNDKWQQLIADYFGAFGAQAMWSDAAYPEYKDALNLRNADNDLGREQIKNAFYGNAKIEVITINPGVANVKLIIDFDDAKPLQFPDYQFPGTFDAASWSTRVVPTYSNILDHETIMELESRGPITIGTTNKILLPDHNGVGAQVLDADPVNADYINMNNHETIYTLHKDNYSEGESLEISQFKCRSIGFRGTFNDSADYYIAEYYIKAQEYLMMDTCVYTFGSNGSQIVEQTYTICDEVVSDDDLQDSESSVDYPDEIMCWALIDWMPFTHITFYSFISAQAQYYPRDVLLIDMDAFGSLDDRAFATSINYSIYSLQAAGLAVGKKRVDNLGDVYKDKPSRRG